MQQQTCAQAGASRGIACNLSVCVGWEEFRLHGVRVNLLNQNEDDENEEAEKKTNQNYRDPFSKKKKKKTGKQRDPVNRQQ